MRTSARITCVVIAVLAAICFALWYSLSREEPGSNLVVSFLNVGEGDAIFIRAPSGRTLLIDSGPDSSVIRQLSDMLPFYDRSIDVFLLTHPDKDHIGGAVDVLERYRVGYLMQSSVAGTSTVYDALEHAANTAKDSGTRVIVAQRGDVIDLGDGARLEILSPDRSVQRTDTNIGCVVSRLVYGSTAFMFPCDAPQTVEKYLVSLDPKDIRADVLKAGHHGSRTSSSPLFIGSVAPSFAVFSRGCDNAFGFPSGETVSLFKRFAIPTFDTCRDGSITFVSDGVVVRRQ